MAAQATTTTMQDVLWSPPPNARETTNIGHYLRWLEEHQGRRFDDYASLWTWSVNDLEEFWTSIWDYFAPAGSDRGNTVLQGSQMPDVRWFPDSTVNYAAQALAHPSDDVAVVAHSQTRDPQTLTFEQLREQVGQCANALLGSGIRPGDRVAAYLPNIPETLVAFLASASIGAVFSSCPPEFGTTSVVDRFSQIEPTVLLVVDGYRHGDKTIDRSDAVAEIRRSLPTVVTTVLIEYAGPVDDLEQLGDITWKDWLADRSTDLAPRPLSFDHPLYILYSSGTTGLPKPIIHGHGGILLEHLKTMSLHLDLGPHDRFFWFSTTGWMVWNFLVSGLLTGTTVVLFDGNPAHPSQETLWQLAQDTETTYLGLSAPFIVNCMKAGLTPGSRFDLSRLRGVGSTGAPLPPEAFRWVYREVSDSVVLGSASGGTDVCTAFVGATPIEPVYAGEIPCRLLGCRVEAFDDDGNPLIDETGELVVTAPMPSMPVGFWGDDGTRYRSSYFDTYPGVWRHGDWVRITERGTCEITGRSDATLNRGGVRMGTGDFYRVLDAMPEIADSLVVHLADDGPMGRLILLITPSEGHELGEDLRGAIREQIKNQLSPRHLPDLVMSIPVVPRTLTGKRLEMPVKRILEGARVEEVVSTGAVQDPRAITAIRDVASSIS